MKNQFDPKNRIIQELLQGMAMEDQGKPEDAQVRFLGAWKNAEDDLERFLAAYFVARHQKTVEERLAWLETSLKHALNVDDDAVKSAFPTLYEKIAHCHEELGDEEKVKWSREQSAAYNVAPSDEGPFYHGTKADLKIGDLLTPKNESNYQTALKMNHVYFTALIPGAGLAAALAKGEGRERVYVVEPTGGVEHDPNVTDKKFPGNLTRSYRSEKPLKIVGEVQDWGHQTTEDIQKWKEKLASNKGEIIN